MARKRAEVSPTEVTAYSVVEAARLLSIGRSSLYRELQAGNIASIKLRKRRLIPATALRDWLARAQVA